MYDRLNLWLEGIAGAEHLVAAIIFLAALAVSIGFGAVLSWLLLPLIRKVVQRTPTQWDKRLEERGFFSHLCWLIPGIAIYNLAANWLAQAPAYATVATTLAHLWLLLAGLLVLHAFLNAMVDIYNTFSFARQMPIRGFVQVVKLITVIVALLIALALLLGKSPALLISGMGAMTAVLMLVFKDPILGFVAGIQLSANRMLAIGDWLEMPKYQADGDVVDITLTTVKVQNWDRTITTIPTYALISDSFRNWRGMQEAGGRRIMRNLNVDITSVHFLDQEEISRLRRLQLISQYIEDKITDIQRHNREHQIDPASPANGRHLTNIGTFRAYLVAYLKRHPGISQNMLMIVRQLQPTAEGLPIEIYAFTNDTRWVQYEGIQADIFDHVFAVAPEFGLRIFQAPSSADLQALAGGRSSLPLPRTSDGEPLHQSAPGQPSTRAE